MRKSVGTAARRLHRLQVVRHLSHVLRAPVRLFGTNLPVGRAFQPEPVSVRLEKRLLSLGHAVCAKVHGAAGRIAEWTCRHEQSHPLGLRALVLFKVAVPGFKLANLAFEVGYLCFQRLFS